MVGFTGVLAHQGGWDEMLLIAAPIVIFVVLLRIANARAAHLRDDGAGPVTPGLDADADDPAGPGPTPTSPTDGGPSRGPDR